MAGKHLTIYTLALAFALFMIVSFAEAPTVTYNYQCTSSTSYDYNCQLTENVITYYSASTGFSQSQSSSSSQAASPVNNYNYNNAPWLLTCPVTPSQNPTTDLYFYPGYPGSGGVANVGGNACQITSSSSTTQVIQQPCLEGAPNGYCGYSACPSGFTCAGLTGQHVRKENGQCATSGGGYAVGSECVGSSSPSLLTTVILPTTTSGDEYDLETASLGSLSVTNPATLSMTNLAYSPMVNSNISNGFSTNSYIFRPVPSMPQNDLWTWTSEFVNFSTTSPYQYTLHVPGLTYTETVTNSNTQNGVTSTNSTTCTYLYDFKQTTELQQISNNYIPFNEVLPTTPPFTTFNTPILPFFTYNFSMPSLYQQSMNLSYDVYGPWNYYTPQNSIDMFPVDVGHNLYVNYCTSSGCSTQYSSSAFCIGNPNNPICLNMPGMPNIPGNGNGNGNGMPGIGITFPGVKNPHIAQPIAIAALPNDYIYILNSTSSGGYNITILRLIPHGYYNTSPYTPNNASLISSQDSEAAWVNQWNAYWSNIINLQNTSTYVLKTISVSNHFSNFNPMGMAVNISGYVYLTGNLTNQAGLGVGAQPELAVITNTLSGTMQFINDTINAPAVMPEIAVSPSGRLVYLANQSVPGYIYVYNGSSPTFNSLYQINLTFGKVISPGNTATLNITYWLANNGLFGQYIPWVATQGNNYNENLDVPEFHHPIGLYDVNGYLYVLDNWGGLLNGNLQSCGNWFGVGCPSGPVSLSNALFFDILLLRAINSTNANVPINPTKFNDMFSTYTCANPTLGQTSINPSTCYSSQLSPSPTCGAHCTLSTSSCEQSAKCPAYNYCFLGGTTPSCGSQCNAVKGNSCDKDKGYYYTCQPNTGTSYACVASGSGSGKKSSTYLSLATSSFFPYDTYPPYGWILSANVSLIGSMTNLGDITGTNVYSINPSEYISISANGIISGPPSEEITPYNAIPSQYPPIGPPVTAIYTAGVNSNNPKLCLGYGLCIGGSTTVNRAIWNGSQEVGGAKTADGFVPFYYNIGYSVNYNHTVDMIFPSFSSSSVLSSECPIFWSCYASNANIYPELAILHAPIDNYTKLFTSAGGETCYSSNNSINTPNGACSYLPTVANMTAPVYSVTDPLKYLENLGSYNQFVTFGGATSSTFTGGSGAPSSNTVCANSIAYNGIGNCNGASLNYNSIYTSANSNYLNPASTASYVSDLETLNSTLNGYVMIPYYYSDTMSYWRYNAQLIAQTTPVSSGPNPPPVACPPASSIDTGPVTTNSLVYTDALVDGNSNKLSSTVEGGDTYFEYPNTSHYVPYLGDNNTIIPPGIFFLTQTDRIFDKVIALLEFNITEYFLNPNEPQYSIANPEVLNATRQFDFYINQITQDSGAYPGYETITISSNPSFNVGDESPQYSFSQFYSPNAIGFNYTPFSIPTAMNLFNWYKFRSYENPLKLYLNSTKLLGYHRFMLNFLDTFNNTIHVPLDADVANTTIISLSSNPAVNTTNPNQTNLYINGTVTSIGFGGTEKNLSGAQVYLYFEKNINYVNFSPEQNPVNAMLCAYTNTIAPNNCILANPVMLNLQANSSIVDFYPMLNSSGACPMPPNSLLNYTYGTPCNIYGYDGLPSNCGQNTYNPNYAEFCQPMYANGTGVCTSQLGLMAIVTTNSNGQFTYNTLVCGVGNPEIIAKFYGSPSPQPVQITQTILSNSTYYGPIPAYPVFAALPVTMNVLNYTQAPNASALQVQIGLLYLSYGSVAVYGILAIAAALLVIAARKIKIFKSEKR